MKKIIIAVAAVALSLAVFGTAAAQQTENWRQQRRQGFIGRHIARDLNLTDAQKASIKTILQYEKPAIESLASQLMDENAQLRSKTTFDEAFVRSVAQQRNATLADALVEREKVRAEIFAVLTPAQQQKANQLADEFRSALQDRIATLGDQL